MTNRSEHFLTLGEASRQTGVAKSTLSNDIKTGKLSVAEKTSSGFRIDPAELFRVYPPKPVHEQDEETLPNPVQNTLAHPFAIVRDDRSEQVIEQYEKRIAELTRALEREKENADYLKEQLTRSTLLLEHHKPVQAAPAEPENPGKRRFLGLFGRKAS